jgi:hypothetical protein
MMKKYFLAWFPMVFIAIFNGIFRETAYKSLVGDLAAHQLSTLTGIMFTGIYIWLITRQWPLTSRTQAITIGLMWLGMTILFEFGFGHYVMKNPWSKLLADYNLLSGRVWSLFLLWITIAPFVFYRLSKNKIIDHG